MTVKHTRWGALGAALVALVLISATALAQTDSDSVPEGINADTVDLHHAAYSGNPMAAARANRVLWAGAGGQLHKNALPAAWLFNTFVNDHMAETIAASSAGTILTVNNTGVGNGIKGIAGGGGDGVVGQAFSNVKSGVYGFHNGSGYGVMGSSANGFGVYACGGSLCDEGPDLTGDLLLGGTRGEIVSAGSYLDLYSRCNVDIDLDDDNNDSNAYFTVWNGTDNPVFSVNEAGQMTASGTKSAVVETASFGTRLLYAMESPEVWFEDFGSASLAGGVAEVAIDAVFAETVNLGVDYHVFVTPLGDCNGLYVAAKTATSFEVRELGGGTADVGFDYRIVARRLGYEDVRLGTPGL